MLYLVLDGHGSTDRSARQRAKAGDRGVTAPARPCSQTARTEQRPERCRACFSFLVVVGLLGGIGYGAMFALANLVQPKPREITVTIPPDNSSSSRAERGGAAMARMAARNRREADRAVSRHAGGRARRRARTRSMPIAATSTISRPICAPGGTIASRRHDDTARLSRAISTSAASQPRRSRGGSRRSASSTASSTPKDIATTIRRPCSKARSAAAPAEGAVGRARSIACCERARAGERRGRSAGRAAARRAARCACSNALRHRACASPNWWRCRRRRRGATSACWSCAARAARSAWCRSTTPPSARWRDYLALRAEAEAAAPTVQMAVSVIRRKRPSDPPAFRPRAQGAGRRCGTRRRAGQPARAAPCLRQPPAAERRRPARGADAARPCRHLDHADLHACAGGAAEEPGARPASAGGEAR